MARGDEHGRSVMRNMLMVGAVLAAVAGVGATAFSPAVEAAPASSPFEGEFSGSVALPGPSYIAFETISISSTGRLVGSNPQGNTAKCSGSVSADGTYALSGSIRFKFNQGPGGWIRDRDVNPRLDPRPDRLESRTDTAKDSAIPTTYYFTSSGTLVLGADGNLYGTTDFGTTFVWTRK
jgi:hypothetical protein